MRILHTSDWHLGQTLHGARRHAAFEAFLNWLVETIRCERVDALVVSGDIFDVLTPSNEAQSLYYRFLCRLHDAKVCRNVIVTAGNHDSASFLMAPAPVLETMDVRVVARPSNSPADDVVAVRDDAGHLLALVCAVPFLREADVAPPLADEAHEARHERIVAGTRRHYEASLAAARSIAQGERANVPIIATGHLAVAGIAGRDAERGLYIGNIGQVPAGIFPQGFDYVALGHIHGARSLTPDGRVRYSGSPLAMSFSEKDDPKSVVLVEFDEDAALQVREIGVPAFDRLKVISGDMEAIAAAIATIAAEDRPVPTLAQVRYVGQATPVDLRERVQALAAGIDQLHVVNVLDENLVRFTQVSDAEQAQAVSQMTPEEVFAMRLRDEKELTDADRDALTELFDEILVAVRAGKEP